MTVRRVISVLGFFSTLPSTYFYIVIGIFLVLSLNNSLRSRFLLGNGLCGLVAIIIFFALTTFIGIFYGQTEAQLYLVRALLGLVIIFLYVSSLNARNDNLYNAYLVGVFSGILLNSVAVLIFSFNPDFYHALQIDKFSNYDKGARLFRSPGLQTGTDSAGYLSVFGIVLYLHLKQKQLASWLTSRKFFYLLLLTPLFCSRSSMILGVLTLLLSLLLWWRVIRPLDKVVMLVCCVLFGVSAVVLVGVLLFPDSLGSLSVSTEIIAGVSVDALYAVDDGGSYIDQYDFDHLYSWIPVGDPLLYDNTWGKLLASMGLGGWVAGMLVVIYVVISLLANAPPGERVFVFLFLVIFLFANAKNNYLFYSFFVSMISVFFCRFAGSARALRPAFAKPLDP